MVTGPKSSCMEECQQEWGEGGPSSGHRGESAGTRGSVFPAAEDEASRLAWR